MRRNSARRSGFRSDIVTHLFQPIKQALPLLQAGVNFRMHIRRETKRSLNSFALLKRSLQSTAPVIKRVVVLEAIKAAAIMWCNLVVPAQFGEAFGSHACHHSSPRTLARTSRNQAFENSSSNQQLGSSSDSRIVAARYLVAALMSSRTTPASRASVGMPSHALTQATMRRALGSLIATPHS